MVFITIWILGVAGHLAFWFKAPTENVYTPLLLLHLLEQEEEDVVYITQRSTVDEEDAVVTVYIWVEYPLHWALFKQIEAHCDIVKLGSKALEYPQHSWYTLSDMQHAPLLLVAMKSVPSFITKLIQNGKCIGTN